MKHLFLLSLAYMVAISSSFGQSAASKPQTLDPKAFNKAIQETPDGVVLDVRTPEEVSKGKIKGAVNIDFNAPDFKKKISKLDKDKPYLVYCAKGVRSSKAVAEMTALGFTKLTNLEGGFDNWKEKEMPVE
jgi:rhodanese-related sulfurtransferase